MKTKRTREEYLKVYREEHKEQIKEYYRQQYQNNKATIDARKKKYREEHAEAHRESDRKYRLGHREQIRISEKKRDAKERELLFTLTLEQWEDTKQYFNNSCCYCGEEVKLEQEHFIALSNGGEYTHNNIIPACRFCNNSKKNRDFFVWYPKYKNYNEKREKIILEFLNYKDKVQQITLAI